MTISYAEAISALGGKNFSVGDDPSEVYYADGNTKNITAEQIQTKYNELVEEDKKIQYQRDRSSEYPSWQEQMDMQYWDAKNGTTTWQEAIEAVKTKYPKGK